MHDLADVADVLEAQTHLNASVANALQSLALQSDRYDYALDRIYHRLDDLESRLHDLVALELEMHSRKAKR